MNGYLKTLTTYIQEYRSRKGGYVFIANILIKFNSLLLSLFIVRLISKDVFGEISYALSIIFPLTAFIGFGANHSLLRFGAIQETFLHKWTIFKYAQKVGTYGSLILVTLLISLSFLITKNSPGAEIFLIILSFQLLFNHWNLTQKSLFRILRLNNLYGYSGIFQSVILLVTSIILVLLFGGIGYVLAIVLAPLLAFVFYRNYFKSFPEPKKLHTLVEKSVFWKYGINVGIGAIASQMLFNVGIIMLGILLPESEEIASYKVASLIPLNLLFIPASFLKGDYVYLAENSFSYEVLSNYVKKYLGLMSLISLAIFVVFFIFSKQITVLLFGQKYLTSHVLLRILTVGIIGAIMFRSLFGNILLAVGKANWNVINAIVILIINIVLGYFLINRHGAIGAAYTLSISLWVGSLFSGLMLIMYLKLFTR